MTGLEMFLADKTAGIIFCVLMLILVIGFLISILKDGF